MCIFLNLHTYFCFKVSFSVCACVVCMHFRQLFNLGQLGTHTVCVPNLEIALRGSTVEPIWLLWFVVFEYISLSFFFVLFFFCFFLYLFINVFHWK